MTSCSSQETKDRTSPSCACREASSHARKPDFPLIGDTTASCCDTQPPIEGQSHEKPGYHLWGFVDDFIPTPAGDVPRVKTRLNREDQRGALFARLGIGRDNYRIAPGLYAAGTPDEMAPVLVTANYKLTFDVLRSHLEGVHAWILVLETRGINVWCAAGKGTFGTREVLERVKAVNLENIVSNRRLILPMLSATGVSARQVKKRSGFEVVWGPVHAKHIPAFLDAGMQTNSTMRKVTFTLRERVVLIPVELNHMGRPSLYMIPALFLLSGLGSGLFSFSAAFARGIPALLAYVSAIVAGAVLVPVLLPWLPGRAFALKGAAIGAAAGSLLSAGFSRQLSPLEMLALTLFITALSSYLSMNFTGSTPFTSPTGVEKEMRRAIPAQAVVVLTAVILWVGVGFTG